MASLISNVYILLSIWVAIKLYLAEVRSIMDYIEDKDYANLAVRLIYIPFIIFFMIFYDLLHRFWKFRAILLLFRAIAS